MKDYKECIDRLHKNIFYARPWYRNQMKGRALASGDALKELQENSNAVTAYSVK